MSALLPAEQDAWSKYIYSICGVSLDASKGYLIETRFSDLIRDTASTSFTELIAKVKGDVSTKLRQKVIDAITTNETSFFRDASPFELLQNKVIPDLIDLRTKTAVPGRPIPIRIWSAAASTGQEAYTIGMICKDLRLDPAKYDVRILGTDISDKAITQASLCKYSQLEISRGLPADKIAKYFTVDGPHYKVRDEVRALATFKKMNLLEPFAFPAPFDIVLCRNVAIYFTEPDRLRLYKAIARSLAPDGYLIIGSTESIAGLCPEFEVKRYLRSAFYQFKKA